MRALPRRSTLRRAPEVGGGNDVRGALAVQIGLCVRAVRALLSPIPDEVTGRSARRAMADQDGPGDGNGNDGQRVTLLCAALVPGDGAVGSPAAAASDQ
jgi:hypothetical protein